MLVILFYIYYICIVNPWCLVTGNVIYNFSKSLMIKDWFLKEKNSSASDLSKENTKVAKVVSEL